MTSIDFGFGRLGYQTFHMLLGDLPGHLAARTEIAAQPVVVDRGSVKLIGR